MKTEENVVVDREAVQPAPSVLPPLPQRIIKRDGAEVPFDARRITVALAKPPVGRPVISARMRRSF